MQKFSAPSKENKKLLALPRSEKAFVDDYYRLLGVEKDATSQEIKAAYRKLVVKFHPDKNKNPRAVITFMRIQEAYKTLSDPISRANYDTNSSSQKYTPTEELAYSSLSLPRSGLLNLVSLMRLLAMCSFGTSSMFEVRTETASAENDSLDIDIRSGIGYMEFVQDLVDDLDDLDDLDNFLISSSDSRQAALYASFALARGLTLAETLAAESTARLLSLAAAQHLTNFAMFGSPLHSPLAIEPIVNLPMVSSNQTSLDETGYAGKIPENYICPLSGEIMTHPVHNEAKGLPNVERAWIIKEIERTHTNPYNREPLNVEDLISNESLKNEIEQFIKNIDKDANCSNASVY